MRATPDKRCPNSRSAMLAAALEPQGGNFAVDPRAVTIEAGDTVE